jgi:osmoprotectant transport system permease protein
MRRPAWCVAFAVVLLSMLLVRAASASDGKPMRVGSKRFVESYILAEVVAQLARAEGAAAEHDQGLGGTAVVFRALEDGSIDVYPEYTGTLAEAAVKNGAAGRYRTRSASRTRMRWR